MPFVPRTTKLERCVEESRAEKFARQPNKRAIDLPYQRGSRPFSAEESMSKFAEFLSQNKLDPRRVICASKHIEALRPEDRRLRQARKKTSDAPKEGDAEVPAKPRSGRPVTRVLMNLASAGKPVPGPAKQRLLRAVNRLLEQKKKDPVELSSLF